MGGENDLSGAARKAARTRRAGTKRKSRLSGLRSAGTRSEGRAGQPSDRREADRQRRRAPRGADMIVSDEDLFAVPADIEKERALGRAAGGAACVRRCA